jgi:two-component system, OmpR family, phosphate regulon response regulator PhoB
MTADSRTSAVGHPAGRRTASGPARDRTANACKTIKPTVLVAEGDRNLARLLQHNLEREGYRILEAMDGEEALLVADECRPDIILLDWTLRQASGLEVCRRLRNGRRETRNVPIVMLSTGCEERDRVRGLDAGADDYVTKPFSMAELLARLRAVMRRIRPALAEDVVCVGDIEMDRTAHRVRRGGHNVRLGPTEFKLLDQLIQNPGRVFSREQLLDAVWGSDVDIGVRTVDVHVGRLRKALDAAGGPDLIRTVRSVGYAIDDAFVN